MSDTSLGVDVVRSVLCDIVVGDCKSSHGQSHTSRSEKHQRTASDLLYDKDRNERSHEIFGAVAGSEELGVVVLTQTDTCVQGWGVVCDQVDS